MKKSLAALGLSATLLGGGAVGAALFAPTLAGAQDDAADVDTDTGAAVDAEPERPEPGDHLADALAPLVGDGTIDQSQADAVIAAILDARPERGGFFERRGFGGGEKLEELTGIAADVWVDGFQNGDSAADIAAANGSSAAELIDDLVTAGTERIQEGVDNGHLTQEQADEMIAGLTERITEQVNGGGPIFGGPGGGLFGRHHR